MTEEELMRLWDPRASAVGAEAVEDLELRVETLRGPRALPPLELPPRTRDTSTVSSREAKRLWAAALVIAAAVLLAFLGLRPWVEDGGGSPPVARAPQIPTPLGKDPPTGWRVEGFEGDAMCSGPGVEETVVRGVPLADDMPLDTGPDTTLRLRHGDAMIELHPNSRVRQRADAFELAHGRMWLDLPVRPDGAAWILRTDGATLRTAHARFVWWSHEVGTDEVGLRIESGSVELDTGRERVTAESGQDCRVSTFSAAEDSGAVHCAPPG